MLGSHARVRRPSRAYTTTLLHTDTPFVVHRSLTRLLARRSPHADLLAFIVGDFDYVSTLVGGVKTTVYTPPGRSALGKHALMVASRALPFFEKQFNKAYPLPKSDLLAIPDFAAGAMENWGAVTCEFALCCRCRRRCRRCRARRPVMLYTHPVLCECRVRRYVLKIRMMTTMMTTIGVAIILMCYVPFCLGTYLS